MSGPKITSLSTAVALTGLLALLQMAAAEAQPGKPHDQRSAELVVPLLSIEPTNATAAPDLQALSVWLGNSRLVGLGESEHGVEDFHRLGHRLFSGLAAEAGFEVFAWEINQAHARLLDAWVQGGAGDLDELLAQHAWPNRVFYSAALRQLLVSMRQHNRIADRPVHLAGFDCKDPRLAMAEVVELLGEIDPAAAKQVAEIYARHQDLPGLGVVPNLSGFSATLDLELPADREGTATLRFGLEARAEGFTHGTVGLWAGPEAELTPDQLDGDWRRWWLEIEVPATATSRQVTIYHRGNGTVWLRQPRVRLGEQQLEPPALDQLRPRPLALPRLQAMDHRWRAEPTDESNSEVTIQVNYDRTLNQVLADIRQVDSMVVQNLAAQPGKLSPEQALWLRQASRLVVQAYEWRTLAEWNRDVFLAENARWLTEQAFPSSRLVLFAHSSHTERLPNRMGDLLNRHFGDSYRTVSLLALAGERFYIDLQKTREMGPDPPFALSPIVRGDQSLERTLSQLAPTDLLFHWRAAQTSPASADLLHAARLPPGRGADVMILLREAKTTAR